MFGPVFVGGADQFDRGHQASAALGVVNADFILVEIRQVGFHGQRGFHRRPNRGGAAVIGRRVRSLRRGLRLCLERCHVNLHLRPQMHAGTGLKLRGKRFRQLLDNDRRPLTVDFFPGSDLTDQRMKRISKRHGRLLSEYVSPNPFYLTDLTEQGRQLGLGPPTMGSRLRSRDRAIKMAGAGIAGSNVGRQKKLSHEPAAHAMPLDLRLGPMPIPLSCTSLGANSK